MAIGKHLRAWLMSMPMIHTRSELHSGQWGTVENQTPALLQVAVGMKGSIRRNLSERSFAWLERVWPGRETNKQVTIFEAT